MLRKLCLSPLVLLAPILTLAQHHSAGVPMQMAPTRAVSPAPAVAMHAGVAGATHPAALPARNTGHPLAPGSTLRPASPRSAHPVAAPRAPGRTRRTQPIPQFADNFAEDDGIGVPGLGFDYTHFAAVHPNANRGHRNGGGFLFPGGVILGGGPLYLEEPAPAAPPSENVQEESPAQSAQDSQDAEPAERVAPVRARRSADVYAPPAQVAEYVFVRRDGTVFFAVAYSWLNGDLEYITKDGLRRTVPRSTLDLDATQQFNDQRGVSFHSPA